MKPSDDEHQGPVIRDRRRIDPQTGQVRDVPGQGQPGPGAGQRGRHSAARPGGPAGQSGQGQGQGAPGAPGAAGPGGPGRGGPGGPGRPGQPGQPGPGGPAGGGGGGGDMAVAEAMAQVAERTADLQRLSAEYANYRKRVERDRMAVREQALANVLSELLPVLDDIGRAREHGELTGGFKSVAESLESAVTKLGLTAFGENGDPFDPTLHDALMHSYSAEVTEPTAVQILQPGYKVGDRIIRPARVAVAEPENGAGPAPDGRPSDGQEQDNEGPDGAGSAGR
jgi:molecular chaperone GrpE